MKRISFLLISVVIMVLGLFSLGYPERGIQVPEIPRNFPPKHIR